MFCSTSTTLNPFTASNGDPSPYINILDHEPNPNSFHLHHLYYPNITINPPLSDSNLLTPALSSNNVMSSKQDIQVTNGDHHHHHYEYGYGASSVFLAKKRAVKKDRHSKIYTAQGLRDRRVRLSIEIARKFFDLQDMLGFDKASKTLEWLLTKSSKAIKELAQDNDNTRCGGAKSFSSNSTCEEVESENGILNGKRTKRLKKKAVALSSPNLAAAKELREKARARARERTRVKLLCSTNTFNQYSKVNSDPTFDQTLNQSKPSSLLNHHQQSSSSASFSSTSFKVVAHNQAEVPNNNIIEESIVIKRKLRPSSMVGTYQQSRLMLKDANCISNNLPNLPPNWDLNNAIARSSLCAIDNMNRSAGLHLYGKLWEAENSEFLR